MAKSFNQKQKLLYILDVLKEKSDDTHVLNVNYIINLLENNGIKAERKSIYDDMESLSNYGYDIVLKKGRNGGYYLRSKMFDKDELKLLADVVQSSKFITDKKSGKLISKLERLTNVYDRKELSGRIVVKERIKKMNESLYNNVDKIQSAILHNAKIRFNYFDWTITKEARLRRNGSIYEISPWMIFFDDINYYLIGYDSETENIKQYRVDKMLNIEKIENLREGKEDFNKFYTLEHIDQAFGINSGVCENVKLICNNNIADEIIDRFGKDIEINKNDENTFCFNINVNVNNQFFGWITGLGTGIKIDSPESVVNNYKSYIKEILKEYN